MNLQCRRVLTGGSVRKLLLRVLISSMRTAFQTKSTSCEMRAGSTLVDLVLIDKWVNIELLRILRQQHGLPAGNFLLCHNDNLSTKLSKCWLQVRCLSDRVKKWKQTCAPCLFARVNSDRSHSWCCRWTEKRWRTGSTMQLGKSKCKVFTAYYSIQGFFYNTVYWKLRNLNRFSMEIVRKEWKTMNIYSFTQEQWRHVQ